MSLNHTLGFGYWKMHTGCQPLDGKIDDRYWLEENSNYPPGEGNVSLMVGKSHTSVRCIGGVDSFAFSPTWTASINTPLDEETDSDSTNIFSGDRAAAIETLWERRFEAYC
jgi:hypothetical protein